MCLYIYIYIPIRYTCILYIPTLLRQRSNYSYNVLALYYIIIVSIRASACELHIEHDIPTGFLLLLIVQYKRSLSLPRSVCCNGYSRYLHRSQTTEIRLPSFAVLLQPLNNIIIIEREKINT